MQVQLVLDIPGDVTPPRHGRVNDGVLARLVAEDLDNLIRDGQALDAELAAGTLVPPTLST